MLRLIIGFLLCCISSYATDLSLISGIDQKQISFESFTNQIEKGSVIVIGESHAQESHANLDQELQYQLITALQKKGLRVSVGMEFISYTHQTSLENYLHAKISESDFLEKISWGRTPFKFYKRQILSPLKSEALSYGINAPRFITKKIFRKGFNSLTPEERALIPADFEVGNDLYFKRFKEAMGGHGDPKFIEQAFVAQSVWDDTMAWSTANILADIDIDVFVIIVGNFHVRYGGGLVDRLSARGLNKVVSLIQTPNLELDDSQRKELAKPHSEYGSVGTYVW